MERNNMCSKQNDITAAVEFDLLDALLHADGVHYHPGNSLPHEMIQVAEDPEATIAQPWTEFDVFAGIDDDEVESRAQSFFAQVDHLWSATTVQHSLMERFGLRMPQELLSTIARQAQHVASQSLSLADQLVQCVRDVVPSLAVDDLEVLARPLAYAMRNGGSGAVQSTLDNLPQHSWQNLSEIHQARLSLAAARCALAELQNSTKD